MIVPIERPSEAVAERFDRFRGKLISTFARAELAVSEMLVALARTAGSGDIVATPLLVGQRLQALDRALEPRRGTLSGAARTLDALAAFRKHDELRQLLCHGVGDVCTTGDGTHLLILDVCVLGGRGARRRRWWIAEAEMPNLVRTVSQDAKTLSDRLKGLQARLDLQSGLDPGSSCPPDVKLHPTHHAAAEPDPG